MYARMMLNRGLQHCLVNILAHDTNVAIAARKDAVIKVKKHKIGHIGPRRPNRTTWVSDR